MFKSATVYRIVPGWNPDAAKIEDALAVHRFTPCGPTQPRSSGWTEPRGKAHGPLLESVAGQWILKLMTEKKDLPASVVAQAVEEKVKEIEEKEDRKPGKREKREIKEDVILALLPKAFVKRSAVTVWIDRRAGLLVLNSTSSATTDNVITLLVNALEGFSVGLINTTHSPAGAMSGWLMDQDITGNFDFGRECDLEATDESKSAVKYNRHQLAIEEIIQHIKSEGKTPKSLGLVWGDRVSFVLNKAMQLKKIAILDDVVMPDAAAKGEVDPFDANVAILTGEFSRMLPDLFAALGGETGHQALEPAGG